MGIIKKGVIVKYKLGMKRNIGMLLILSICISGCAGVKNLSKGKILVAPTYQLEKISFKEVDLKQLKLNATLKINNPNYIALNFTQVSYTIKVNGRETISGELAEGIRVPAKKEISAVLPINIELEKLASGAVAMLIQQKIDYDLTVRLTSELPIIDEKQFSVSRKGELKF